MIATLETVGQDARPTAALVAIANSTRTCESTWIAGEIYREHGLGCYDNRETEVGGRGPAVEQTQPDTFHMSSAANRRCTCNCQPDAFPENPASAFTIILRKSFHWYREIGMHMCQCKQTIDSIHGRSLGNLMCHQLFTVCNKKKKPLIDDANTFNVQSKA